jgi:hypothetical protein
MVDLLQVCRGSGDGGRDTPDAVSAAVYAQVLWYYGKIKSVITFCNSSFGYFYFSLIVLVIPYHPLWNGILLLDMTVQNPTHFIASLLLMTIQAVSIYGILTLCAEVTAKVNSTEY